MVIIICGAYPNAKKAVDDNYYSKGLFKNSDNCLLTTLQIIGQSHSCNIFQSH